MIFEAKSLRPLKTAALMLSLAGGTFTFACPAFAGTMQGSAETQVIRSGSLNNTQTLDFGHIVPGTGTSYLVVPATSDTITVQSGNAVPAGGTVSRGEFVALTLPINVITVSLPNTATLTRNGGTETITVDNFQHNLTGGIPIPLVGTAYNILNNGTLTFKVGARIRVNAGQAQGHYTGTYTVTANFF